MSAHPLYAAHCEHGDSVKESPNIAEFVRGAKIITFSTADPPISTLMPTQGMHRLSTHHDSTPKTTPNGIRVNLVKLRMKTCAKVLNMRNFTIFTQFSLELFQIGEMAYQTLIDLLAYVTVHETTRLSENRPRNREFVGQMWA